MEVENEGLMVLPSTYAEGEDRLVNVLNIKGKVDGLIKNYRTLVCSFWKGMV